MEEKRLWRRAEWRPGNQEGDIFTHTNIILGLGYHVLNVQSDFIVKRTEKEKRGALHVTESEL